MIGEIICVGNELLIGDTLNTNTQYLSRKLTELGIEVGYQVVVGDYEDHLTAAIESAKKRSDVVIFSGGLGPTYDDMTKETVTKVLGMSLVLDEKAFADLKEFFKRRNMPMAKTNEKQAYRPSGGRTIDNHNGTAPGIYVEKDGVHFILLPGPPRELKPMFEENVKPILAALSSDVITSRIFQLCGIGESDLAHQMGHIMDVSTNPRIAPYAKLGSVNIRVTATTATKEEGNALIELTTLQLMPYLEDYCYSYEGQSFEEVIVGLIKKNQHTIAVAESCSGGILSSRLVSVAGVSEVYKNGFITYSNESKSKWLNVPEEMITTYGAVSEEVAIAMAEGVAKVSEATIGIGITGIAGPDGGTEEKPVGTVCICVKINDRTSVQTYHFSGNRKKIRDYSAQYALLMLYKILK